MQEVGQFLKEERIRQDVSLKDLSRYTCVSVRMLQALEDGRYEDVGTPLLIRAFIRSYCNAIGIDPEPILEKYGAEIHQYDTQNENLKRYDTWMHRSKRKTRSLLYLLAGGLVVLFMAGGIGLWMSRRASEKQSAVQVPEALMYSQKELPGDLPKHEDQLKQRARSEQLVEKKIPEPPKEEVDISKRESTEKHVANGSESADTTKDISPRQEEAQVVEESQQGPAKLDVLPATTEPKPNTHRLVLVAKGKTWLRVVRANGQKEDCVLKPGEKKEWEIEGSVRLWLGNAGGVEGFWDGQPLKSFGKRGEVKRLRLPDSKYLIPQ